VTVHDTEGGQVFVHREGGGGSADGRGFMRLQDDLEFRLYSKANRALAEAYSGDVVVTVNLELDPNIVHKTGINLPDDGIPPNLVETTRTESGIPTPAVKGDPSSAENAGDAPKPGGKQTTSSDKSEMKKTDAALYGQKIETMLAPSTRRITASVLVNDEAVLEADRPQIEQTIQDIVSKSIGIDPVRDGADAVTVAFMKFAPVDLPLQAEGTDYMELARSFAPAAGHVLAVLLVLMFLRGMLKRVQPRRDAISPALADVEEDVENLAPEEAARRMRKEIEKAIGEDPAAISRMLENWLTEQRA
jgi:flagellar biosynthesis/type III secretory pathway M-ring protein FliF/YscJ